MTPSAFVIRGGNEAKAWTLADMPHALRDAFAYGPLPDEKRLRRQPETPHAVPGDFAVLEAEFNMWANPLKPMYAEEKALYLAAFDWLETAIADGCTETDAKRPLITWLQKRGLSTCENTMRRVFNAKLKAWRDGGPKALNDGRKEANAARRAPVLSEADEKLLVECAAMKCDGLIAPAWRQCYPQLSSEIRNRYSCFLAGTRRKDYVPKAIAGAIAPKVELAWIEHQGAGYAKLHGPFIPRTWKDLHTGDIISTDDATLEVYGAALLPGGGFKCIRGQFFPWIDEKSKFVFAYSLLAKEHFNGRDILDGLYDALETIGIPRKKLRTENGIFKRSRWLGRGEQILWSQNRELFTDRLGIEWSFTQPRNPRGKIVENILRLIIKRLSCQVMFVGRHEQVTAREDVQWAIRAVNDGRKHPHEVGMFTFDEWEQELENVIGEYNAEVQQNAVVYDGETLSPLQAYEKFLLRDATSKPIPLAPFPHELRLMLSQPRPSTVGGNGVRTFLPGTKVPVYFDSVELSRRRYQQVLVRIDPGNLDEILVTDHRGENPLLVPRLVEVPADGATAEQMHAAMESIKARSEYGKTYYRSLRPDSHPGFSPVILDAEARNTLVEIKTQRGAQSHQRRAETVHQRTVATHKNRAIETLQAFLK